jgi:hypothetical protein
MTIKIKTSHVYASEMNFSSSQGEAEVKYLEEVSFN